MIKKRRQSCAIFVVLCCLLAAASSDVSTKSTGNVDDLQTVFSEPSVSVMKPPTRYQYGNDVKQCPTGESKMMLTLLLKSMRWNRISEKKKEKAIKKLSRFFLIPRQFITVDDTHTPEIVEMVKNSINKSNNILNPKESVGRVEFQIGCGDKVFENGKSIAHQIDEQIRTGVLEELTSGLPFDYWNIWTKHVKSRVQRTKRQADGSGDNDGAEDDYDYEDTDDEDNETNNQDELPTRQQGQNRKKPKTIVKQTHNAEEEPSEPHQEGAEAEDEVENDNEKQKVDDYDVSTSGRKFGEDQDERESKIIKLDVVQTPAIPLVPTEENEAITSRTIRINEDFPTPIDPIESTKLETIVNKTIVNDNNVFDVPLVSERDEDQLLAEVMRVSEQPATEPTIMDFERGLTITTTQQTVERSSEEEVVTTTKAPSTTIVEQESDYSANSNPMTSPPESDDNDDALDVEETFLAPSPNESANNEDINNEELEQSSIETTTMTSSTASSTTAKFVDVIETTPAAMPEDDDVSENVENVDESSTTAASTTTSSTSSAVPSTTQEQLIEIESETSPHTQSMTSTLSPPSIDLDSDTLTTTEIPSTSSTTTTTVVSIVVESITSAEDLDKATTSEKPRKTTQGEPSQEESNYDDDYNDTLEENAVDDSNKSTRSSSSTPTAPRAKSEENSGSDDYGDSDTPKKSSTARPTEADNLENTPDNDSDDYEENQFDKNSEPYLQRRIPKAVAVAGRAFVIKIDEQTFADSDAGDELTLKLLDKDKKELPANSWIQYNAEKREIYGLALEADVSRHEFKVQASDKAGATAEEAFDITVMQYRGSRSINHEIGVKVKLEKPFRTHVDWQLKLIEGIVEVLGDSNMDNIIVSQITPKASDPQSFTFLYTNDSLSREVCPKEDLEHLMHHLSKNALNVALEKEMIVKSVDKELVGICKEKSVEKPSLPSGKNVNFPPTLRNPIDRLDATIGQLLVFPVPHDTFYDPEDQHDLKLTLLKEDRSPVDPSNWLQFDVRNKEFYGVPTIRESNDQGYILMGEDKDGAIVSDALVVGINDEYYKKDLSVNFEFNLDISIHQFNHPAMKRKFVESVAKIFNDSHTGNVIIGNVKDKYDKHTSVFVHNVTLLSRGSCPENIIEELRNKILRSDGNVQDRVKEILGSDFPIVKINVSPMGNCVNAGYHHPDEVTPTTETNPAYINNDLLVTYFLPTGIILLMFLIAFIIACFFYKRRNTGKMELGDEEERKSFRSKGIPVIFQDELEEKPEIATKSPIILKDEKPPLLPQYNGLNNHDDEENVHDYIPPQPLLMGNRESRGKSPVTPSYRKPPPYVSP